MGIRELSVLFTVAILFVLVGITMAIRAPRIAAFFARQTAFRSSTNSRTFFWRTWAVMLIGGGTFVAGIIAWFWLR
jgi:hypothetical protein